MPRRGWDGGGATIRPGRPGRPITVTATSFGSLGVRLGMRGRSIGSSDAWRSGATVRIVERYELAEAAERAGIRPDELRRLVELGIIRPDSEGRFTAGNFAAWAWCAGLRRPGVPLDGLGAAIRSGRFSLDFLDEPAYERFSAFSVARHYADVAEQRAPVQLLMLIREAAGSPAPHPTTACATRSCRTPTSSGPRSRAGFHPAAIERLLRVQGDSLRRMTETETAWWSTPRCSRPPPRPAGGPTRSWASTSPTG